MDGRQYIPAIGGAKGLFEIFIPGVFLLLNIIYIINILLVNQLVESKTVQTVELNPLLSIIIIIVFGYLMGVILWLTRADRPDRHSVYLYKFILSIKQLHYVKTIYSKIWKNSGKSLHEEINMYSEGFPYFGIIGEICKANFPKNAEYFYNNYWISKEQKNYNNKNFFNYYKVIISTLNQKSSDELYAAESLIRYIAAMYHALFVSLIFNLLIIIYLFLWIHHVIQWLAKMIPYHNISLINATVPFYNENIHFHSMSLALSLFLIFLYSIALIVILWHFRYMRVKEVLTLFTSAIANKKELIKILK